MIIRVPEEMRNTAAQRAGKFQFDYSAHKTIQNGRKESMMIGGLVLEEILRAHPDLKDWMPTDNNGYDLIHPSRLTAEIKCNNGIVRGSWASFLIQPVSLWRIRADVVIMGRYDDDRREARILGCMDARQLILRARYMDAGQKSSSGVTCRVASCEILSSEMLPISALSSFKKTCPMP